MSGQKASEDAFASGETLDASDAPLGVPNPPRARSIGDDLDDLLAVDPKHYAIGDELARGGMGRIVRARDLRLGRVVAIKELLPGHDDTRFEREARITARLQHPSIVSVHEAGRWPTGEPFFAMKLVAGKPLDRLIAATSGLAERLAIVPSVIATVDALAYAHSERVVHRDLKPANILCGDFGETVVIDWGLAKDLAAGDADDIAAGPVRTPAHSTETVAGAVMGTPAYMPPEQAAGERVDARADVYALGAILYHVLAGAPPYEASTSQEVLQRVLAAPPPALADRAPDAPADLVAIVAKAMARAPADRFPTAKEMADELKRFQTGKLVTSHHYTVGELVRRWIRQHRGAVAVGAIAFVALAVVAVTLLAQVMAARRTADDEAALARARADAATIESARAALDTDPTEALALLSTLSPGAPEWRAARMIAADADARGFARVLRHDPAAGPLHGAQHFAFGTTTLAFDGRRLASVDEENRIRVLDLATGAASTIYDDGVVSIAFTHDGELVHTASDGRISVWSSQTGVDRPLHGAANEEAIVTVSPDGRWLVRWGLETDARLVDTRTGAERVIGPYGKVAWSSDGRWLLGNNRNDSGEFVRIEPTKLASTHLSRGVDAVGLAVDATHAWAGKYGGQLIDLVTHREVPSGHHGPLTLLSDLPGGAVAIGSSHYTFFSHEGEIEAWEGDDTITIFDGALHDLPVLRGHRTELRALATAPDGRVVSADLDGEVRIWQRAPIAAIPSDDHTVGGVVRLDDHTIAIARRGPAFEVRDLATSAVVRHIAVTAYPPGYEIPSQDTESEHIVDIGDRRFAERTTGTDDAVVAIAHATDPRYAITLDEKKHAVVWDLEHGTGRMLVDDAMHVAISGDGTRAATFDHDTVHTWDTRTGLGHEVALNMRATALALSPDGTKLAVATTVPQLIMFDHDTHPKAFETEENTFNTIAFSSDGRLLAGGSLRKVHVFDVTTGTDRELGAHGGAVMSVAFDRDNQRVISTSTDATVRIVRLADGAVHVLRGHAKRVLSVEIAGDLVVTASEDRTARVWDLANELGRLLPGHDGIVEYAGPAPGGFVTVDQDHRISTYVDRVPYGELAMRAWLAANITSSPRAR